mgnify:CR=1 FL=1
MEGSSDGWYVFETTIDYFPNKPIPLKGSNYWVDSMANWKYQGCPKKDYLMVFLNGIQPSGKPKMTQRLKLDKKKRENITLYWKQVLKHGYNPDIRQDFGAD